MKVKIVIQTWESTPTENVFNVKFRRRQSEVWSGELDIVNEQEYLAKISIIAEGEPQPIADIPFAIGIGHYMWIPPDIVIDNEDDGWSLHSDPEDDAPEWSLN